MPGFVGPDFAGALGGAERVVVGASGGFEVGACGDSGLFSGLEPAAGAADGAGAGLWASGESAGSEPSASAGRERKPESAARVAMQNRAPGMPREERTTRAPGQDLTEAIRKR